MFSTGGLPVDLGAAGATTNDAGDSDSGANDLRNFRFVLHAYRSPSANWVEATLDSSPNDAFRVDCIGTRGNVTYFVGRGDSGVTEPALMCTPG